MKTLKEFHQEALKVSQDWDLRHENLLEYARELATINGRKWSDCSYLERDVYIQEARKFVDLKR